MKVELLSDFFWRELNEIHTLAGKAWKNITLPSNYFCIPLWGEIRKYIGGNFFHSFKKLVSVHFIKKGARIKLILMINVVPEIYSIL